MPFGHSKAIDYAIQSQSSTRHCSGAVGAPANGHYQPPANGYIAIAPQVAHMQQQVDHYMEGFKAGWASLMYDYGEELAH